MAVKTLFWSVTMMLMTVVSSTNAQIHETSSSNEEFEVATNASNGEYEVASTSNGTADTPTLYGNSNDEFESAALTVTQLQYNLLTAVNVQRRAYGLSALCMNSKLLVAAQLHSADQASHDTMSHTGSDGSTLKTRILAQGFTSYSRIGENVAAGQSTVTRVMTSWMNSPGHRANILGDYTYFGCGYSYTSQGMYHHYWTQDFGSASAEVCTS